MTQAITVITPRSDGDLKKDKVVEEVFDGPFRKLLAIRLRNNAILSKHSSTEPITVFCLSGNGTFYAGSDLKESQKLSAGTLITLDANVEHEVTAEPNIHILVTKFKAS